MYIDMDTSTKFSSSSSPAGNHKRTKLLGMLEVAAKRMRYKECKALFSGVETRDEKVWICKHMIDFVMLLGTTARMMRIWLTALKSVDPNSLQTIFEVIEPRLVDTIGEYNIAEIFNDTQIASYWCANTKLTQEGVLRRARDDASDTGGATWFIESVLIPTNYPCTQTTFQRLFEFELASGECNLTALLQLAIKQKTAFNITETQAMSLVATNTIDTALAWFTYVGYHVNATLYSDLLYKTTKAEDLYEVFSYPTSLTAEEYIRLLEYKDDDIKRRWFGMQAERHKLMHMVYRELSVLRRYTNEDEDFEEYEQHKNNKIKRVVLEVLNCIPTFPTDVAILVSMYSSCCLIPLSQRLLVCKITKCISTKR